MACGSKCHTHTLNVKNPASEWDHPNAKPGCGLGLGDDHIDKQQWLPAESPSNACPCAAFACKCILERKKKRHFRYVFAYNMHELSMSTGDSVGIEDGIYVHSSYL